MVDIQTMFDLHGKTVVITGGAGYLGSAMSEVLAAAGADLFIFGQHHDKNKAKAEELKERYELTICKSVTFNLGSTKSTLAAVDRVIEDTGKIDVLINNAAFSSPATRFTDFSDEEWCRAIDGTVNATARISRIVLSRMLSAHNGNIINIGSMYGMVSPDMRIYGDSGQNNPANYGAGKAAVIQLTKYIACVYGGEGIRANSVSPGPFPNKTTQKNTEFIKNLSAKVPMKRIGQPEELQGIILFLASDASSYVNGQNIAVDGGWTAW